LALKAAILSHFHNNSVFCAASQNIGSTTRWNKALRKAPFMRIMTKSSNNLLPDATFEPDRLHHIAIICSD
jgi:hypothetical protein